MLRTGPTLVVSAVGLLACLSASQAAEIRGSVVGDGQEPLAPASVRIVPKNGSVASAISASLKPGGIYRFTAVSPGEYDLTIKAGFLYYDVTIRSIRVTEDEVRILAPIELRLNWECLGDPRPTYYRPDDSGTGTGLLSGLVFTENLHPVANPKVTLYSKNSAKSPLPLPPVTAASHSKVCRRAPITGSHSQLRVTSTRSLQTCASNQAMKPATPSPWNPAQRGNASLI